MASYYILHRQGKYSKGNVLELSDHKQSRYLSQIIDLPCVEEVWNYSKAMLIDITQDCSQHSVDGCICARMDALDFPPMLSLYESLITRLMDP